MDTFHAEASILGSILMESALFKELQLDERYFAYREHRKIYLAMKQVSLQGKDVDIVTVTTILGEEIGEIGGVSYLTKMAESVPSTATFKHYEQIIMEAYQLREAKHKVNGFLRDASLEGLDLLIKDLTTCRSFALAEQEASTYEHLIEISRELLNPKEEDLGYFTSLESFDEMTGGLQVGDLIIVAARPSVGKTAFALNVARGHCKRGGSALIFSLEMGTKQLLKRLISAEGEINGSKWLDIQRLFTISDYENAMRAIGEMTHWRIDVKERKHSLSEIRAEIRKAIHDHPEEKPLVVIDYLQLIRPVVTRRDRRDLEIGEITRELKLLALELEIPIVLLSQLSRSVDSRQDKRPLMSDLRESGNIEQDADVIAFLYRDDYYNKRSEEQRKLEVIIAKQRNGPTGVVEMEFWREYGVVS